MSKNKGYTHIYTGDGKGKTTAAIGLAIRGAGHGKNIFIGQFMKGQYYGELSTLKLIPEIDIEQFGDKICIHKNEVTSSHINDAKKGLDRICKAMESGKYQIVIMDEICVTLWFELVTINEVLEIIKNKPIEIELVLTGRKAPQEFIDAADLVTEMKEIKHYYTQGVMARNGIEK